MALLLNNNRSQGKKISALLEQMDSIIFRYNIQLKLLMLRNRGKGLNGFPMSIFSQLKENVYVRN
jgi:hypothetical protein